MTEEVTGYDTQMIPISLATPVYDRETVERALNPKQTNTHYFAWYNRLKNKTHGLILFLKVEHRFNYAFETGNSRFAFEFLFKQLWQSLYAITVYSQLYMMKPLEAAHNNAHWLLPDTSLN